MSAIEKKLSNSAANPAATLIAGAMNNDTAQNNRQAKLTEYMFGNEVTYSASQLEKFLSKSGTARREVVQGMIVNISDSYAETLALEGTLSEKLKSDKSKARTSVTGSDALQLEAVKAKLRAAEILFTRAAVSVHYLRSINAKRFSIVRDGVAFSQPELKDGKPTGDMIKVSMSATALTRIADKAVRAKFPSERASKPGNGNGNASAPSPVASLSPQADLIVNRLRVNRLNGNPYPVQANGKETEALDKLFHELFANKFLDDKGMLDKAALEEYIADEFAKPQPPVAKHNGNGNGNANGDKAKVA